MGLMEVIFWVAAMGIGSFLAVATLLSVAGVNMDWKRGRNTHIQAQLHNNHNKIIPFSEFIIFMRICENVKSFKTKIIEITSLIMHYQWIQWDNK